MWSDRVSNPGPLTCESGALPTALRGPAIFIEMLVMLYIQCIVHKLEKTRNKYMF